jgi:hypothetical protein
MVMWGEHDRVAWLTHLALGNLVLDEEGAQLGLAGEALDLLAVDGAHERRLTAVVRAQQAVEPVTLQTTKHKHTTRELLACPSHP